MGLEKPHDIQQSHLGHGNRHNQYKLRYEKIEHNPAEKGLGLLTVERAGAVQHREEKALGRPESGLSLSKGRLKKGNRLFSRVCGGRTGKV